MQTRKKMNLKIIEIFKKYKIHILIWFFFIVYETLVVGLLYGIWANPLTYFLHYLVIVPLFYIHADLALVWALNNKKHSLIKLPIIVIIQLIVCVISHYAVDLLLIYANAVKVKLPYELNTSFILRNLYRGIFFMGFSTGYYFLRTYLKEKKHSTDLERDRLNDIIKQKSTEQELFKTQNAFLKAQINPHFLFNTLNFIHNKVSVSSPEAADAIIALSDMMRYAITSGENSGLIKLADEMEQTINLISLFKLRKSESLYLKLNFAENVKELQLIPLVLLTIAENMFKHGRLDEMVHQATLNVYLEKEMLILESYNLSQPKKSNRSHTGLENIKNRLVYAYGNQVQFEYGIDSNQYFRLKICLPLQHIHDYAR